MIKVQHLFLLIFLLASVTGMSQQTLPVILKGLPESGKSNTAFIPKGWKVVHKKTADFNDDKVNDMAMIAEGKALIDGATSNDQVDQMRIIVILFGDAGGYKLSVKMPLVLNSDAPYYLDSLSVRDGKLSFCFNIDTYPNGSGLDLAYRYKNNNWYLAGFTKDYYIGDEGVKNPPHMLKIRDTETGITELYQLKGKTKMLKKKTRKTDKAMSPISEMSNIDVYNL